MANEDFLFPGLRLTKMDVDDTFSKNNTLSHSSDQSKTSPQTSPIQRKKENSSGSTEISVMGGVISGKIVSKGSSDEELAKKNSEEKEICPICLGTITELCAAGSCLHRFCFGCLKKWTLVKSNCPLCKNKLQTILYDIKNDSDYKVYTIPAKEIPVLNSDNSSYHPLSFIIRPIGPPPAIRIRPDIHSTRRRRRIYNDDLWVQFPSFSSVVRYCTPEMYRERPGLTHVLYPWVMRELQALRVQNHFVDTIIDSLRDFRITSRRFKLIIWPRLKHNTDHFIHEFNCFAHSPYDMIGYDEATADRYGIYQSRVGPPLTVDHSYLESINTDTVEIDLTNESDDRISPTNNSEATVDTDITSLERDLTQDSNLNLNAISHSSSSAPANRHVSNISFFPSDIPSDSSNDLETIRHCKGSSSTSADKFQSSSSLDNSSEVVRLVHVDRSNSSSSSTNVTPVLIKRDKNDSPSSIDRTERPVRNTHVFSSCIGRKNSFRKNRIGSISPSREDDVELLEIKNIFSRFRKTHKLLLPGSSSSIGRPRGSNRLDDSSPENLTILDCLPSALVNVPNRGSSSSPLIRSQTGHNKRKNPSTSRRNNDLSRQKQINTTPTITEDDPSTSSVNRDVVVITSGSDTDVLLDKSAYHSKRRKKPKFKRKRRSSTSRVHESIVISSSESEERIRPPRKSKKLALVRDFPFPSSSSRQVRPEREPKDHPSRIKSSKKLKQSVTSS